MNKRVNKKASINHRQCVACGYCMHNCPLSAISINSGRFAQVDSLKCVGCSKCSRLCPAAAINMVGEVITNA